MSILVSISRPEMSDFTLYTYPLSPFSPLARPARISDDLKIKMCKSFLSFRKKERLSRLIDFGQQDVKSMPSSKHSVDATTATSQESYVHEWFARV